MKHTMLGTMAAFMAAVMATLIQPAAAAAADPVEGHWLVTADLHGTPIYGRLDFERRGRGGNGPAGVVLKISKDRLKSLAGNEKK